jgi:hypothetical protein
MNNVIIGQLSKYFKEMIEEIFLEAKHQALLVSFEEKH